MSHVHSQSSSVHSHDYDADTQELTVTFKTKDGSPGSTYVYSGVEPEHHDGLKSAGSSGEYLSRHIKSGGYAYRRA